MPDPQVLDALARDRERHEPASGTRRLVALDLDGTVLGHDGSLSAAVRDEVRRVRDAGHQIVIATGRPVDATLPIMADLGLTEGWAVCCNGAVTVRVDPGRPQGFDVEDVVTFDPGPVLEIMNEHVPGALYMVEDGTLRRWVTGPFPVGELTEPLYVVPFRQLAHRPACRVVVRSTTATSHDFLDLVQQVGLHGVNYAVGWTAWLDLAPEGVTKASALEQVRRQSGIDAAATVAVGDGRNDIEMLRWATRGVAMGQAPAEVVAAAVERTGTVADDGLATLLHTL